MLLRVNNAEELLLDVPILLMMLYLLDFILG